MDHSLGRFRYLVENPKRKKGKGNIGESVITHFGGKAAIIKDQLIIIWSHKSYAYYVFDSVTNLIHFLNETPVDDLHYSEVIFQEAPQRARIDIDDGNISFFNKVKNALKMITDDPIIVCDQSTEEYLSRHIIVDHFYKTMQEAKRSIVDKVIELVGNEDNAIDLNVYHAIQNFRLVGSSKVGVNQPEKRIITRGATFEQTLIGNYKLLT